MSKKIAANRSKTHKINEHEAYLYHVQLTNEIHIPSKKKYVQNVKIVKISIEQFQVIEKNLGKMNDKIEILHDPSVLPKKEFPVTGGADLDRITAEIKKKTAILELEKAETDLLKSKSDAADALAEKAKIEAEVKEKTEEDQKIKDAGELEALKETVAKLVEEGKIKKLPHPSMGIDKLKELIESVK